MDTAEVIRQAMSILGRKGGSVHKPGPDAMRDLAKRSWTPEARAKRLRKHTAGQSPVTAENK